MFRKINPLSLEGRGTKLLVSVSELTISGVGDGTNSRFELAQGDSSVTSFPQNDMNNKKTKCRDSAVNNNCRQGKRQRRVLSERSEFTRQNAESSKLLENGACGWFASLCHQSDRRPRRTK